MIPYVKNNRVYWVVINVIIYTHNYKSALFVQFVLNGQLKFLSLALARRAACSNFQYYCVNFIFLVYILNSNILRLLFMVRNLGKKLEIYLWYYVAVVREGKKVKVLICLEELDLVRCDGWSLLFQNICLWITFVSFWYVVRFLTRFVWPWGLNLL